MSEQPAQEAVMRYLHDFSSSIVQLPGAEWIELDQLQAVFTHRAMFNRFFDRFIPSRTTEDDVQPVADLCAQRSVRAVWIIDRGRIDQPFEQALQQRRFRLQSTWTGMWMPLTARAPETPQAFAMERVETPAQLDEWAQVSTRVEDYSPAQFETFRDLFLALGWTTSGWQHFIARVDQRAVAVASLFLRGDVVAIDWVETLPEMRGKGIASALVSALLAVASHEAKMAVLTSTEMGRGVYAKLGFVPCSTIDAYRYDGEIAE
jgi:GNAT superfamily N-acetyltransferase